MPLQPELADLRGRLAACGVAADPATLALTFRRRGARLADHDEVVSVCSGAVDADGVVTDDALLLVEPSPSPGGAPSDGLRLLAVDVETTGLVAGRDRIVSIGWVPVDGDRLDLAGARRFVVRGDDPGGDAAAIHGLTRDDLAAGTPLPVVLAALRAAAAGRALLAHHAPFDLGFLRAAHREVGERMPRVAVVDTLTLQRRLLRADRPAAWPPGALRLWEARRRYGLPAGTPHDALGDALACAELYLAQAAELGRGRGVTLREVRMPTGVRPWLRRRWRRARRRWQRRVGRSGRR